LTQIPNGNIDAVVSGVGTGGTIVGLTQAFKKAGCECLPFIAIPTKTTNMGGVECASFSAQIPGIVDSLSKIYDRSQMPDAIEVRIDDHDAIETTRELMKLGFPVGPSSGLNYAAARLIAKKLGADAQIVTVFPDGMEKYFSTELFAPIQKLCKK
jgi:cysteine synthase A